MSFAEWMRDGYNEHTEGDILKPVCGPLRHQTNYANNVHISHVLFRRSATAVKFLLMRTSADCYQGKRVPWCASKNRISFSLFFNATFWWHCFSKFLPFFPYSVGIKNLTLQNNNAMLERCNHSTTDRKTF